MPSWNALQRETFSYFLHETNPQNGLVRDKTAPDWPSSIAATGLALAAYPVAVERGFITRAGGGRDGPRHTAIFLEQPAGPRAGRYRLSRLLLSFSGHADRPARLAMRTVDGGQRDSAAGALTAGAYFDADTTEEEEIRALADALYRRADWPWAQNGGATVTHGWKPESGFLK